VCDGFERFVAKVSCPVPDRDRGRNGTITVDATAVRIQPGQRSRNRILQRYTAPIYFRPPAADIRSRNETNERRACGRFLCFTNSTGAYGYSIRRRWCIRAVRVTPSEIISRTIRRGVTSVCEKRRTLPWSGRIF